MGRIELPQAPPYMGGLPALGETWSETDWQRQSERAILIADALAGALDADKERRIRHLVRGGADGISRSASMLIVESAGLIYDVTVEEIVGPSREPQVREARRSAARHMAKRLGLSRARIGELMGGRRQETMTQIISSPRRPNRAQERDHHLTWQVTLARAAVNTSGWILSRRNRPVG